MSIKTTIRNAIALLFPVTVDGVLARFERDVQKLNALAANHRAAAELHEELAEEFYAMSDDSHAEADRAERVAERVRALID